MARHWTFLVVSCIHVIIQMLNYYGQVLRLKVGGNLLPNEKLVTYTQGGPSKNLIAVFLMLIMP